MSPVSAESIYSKPVFTEINSAKGGSSAVWACQQRDSLISCMQLLIIDQQMIVSKKPESASVCQPWYQLGP